MTWKSGKKLLTESLSPRITFFGEDDFSFDIQHFDIKRLVHTIYRQIGKKTKTGATIVIWYIVILSLCDTVDNSKHIWEWHWWSDKSFKEWYCTGQQSRFLHQCLVDILCEQYPVEYNHSFQDCVHCLDVGDVCASTCLLKESALVPRSPWHPTLTPSVRAKFRLTLATCRKFAKIGPKFGGEARPGATNHMRLWAHLLHI